LLYQIPPSHRPEEKYLVYLYTNGLQGHLSFLLNKKKPKTLPEAHDMAIQIEKSLSMTKTNAMDTLSLIKLVSHGNFVEDTQERGEQVFNQQNEDMDEEQEPEQDDEVSTCAPPSDEAIQEPFSPAQQKKMRLVVSLQGIPMTPCSLIQRVRKKWKPWTKWMFLAVQSKTKKQFMMMKQ
jgi:hypothetical protein